MKLTVIAGHTEQGGVLVEVYAVDVCVVAAPPQLRHHLPRGGVPHPHQGALLARRGQPGALDVQDKAREGAVMGGNI